MIAMLVLACSCAARAGSSTAVLSTWRSPLLSAGSTATVELIPVFGADALKSVKSVSVLRHSIIISRPGTGNSKLQ